MIRTLVKNAAAVALIYCAFFSALIGVSGFFAARQGNFVFQLVFLPVPIFFLAALFGKLKSGVFLYYSFVLTAIMAIAGLLGARSNAEVVSALLFLPLPIYLFFSILPRKRNALPVPARELLKTPAGKIAKADEIDKPIKLKRNFDVDRRMFIKLIGSAGLSLFFLAIFTRRAHGAFFGSVPGPGTVALKDTTGAQIDPAVEHPTDKYKISEIDDSSPAYYGFVDKDGNWYILKEDSSGAYRYAKGSSNFSTNWTNRASLTYDYFHNVF